MNSEGDMDFLDEVVHGIGKGQHSAYINNMQYATMEDLFCLERMIDRAPRRHACAQNILFAHLLPILKGLVLSGAVAEL